MLDVFSSFNCTNLWCTREARDENAIREPKSMLYGMRKALSYFVTKLRNLHKMKGFKFLRIAYSRGKNDVKYSFRGYYVFSSVQDIMSRIESRRPVSCFVVGDNYNTVHVAYNRTSGNEDISYLSFKIRNEVSSVDNCGLHYCYFERCADLTTMKKEDLAITEYAIMLPYYGDCNVGHADEQQSPLHTLIYSDWEVLKFDYSSNDGVQKGFVPLDQCLFSL